MFQQKGVMRMNTKVGLTRNTVVLAKEDFSASANALQIWETLIEGMPTDTTTVEVLVLRSMDA
jgi:hypothetical protein